jgi:adenylyltransferase/sulfurtransferase
VLNCAEGGVLGVLPGIIGTMQANETIKLITGIGEPLINKLLTYNSLNNQVYELEIHVNAETHSMIPANRAAFESTPYEGACIVVENSFEIDDSFFNQLISTGNIDVIDIREQGETPVIDEFDHYKIPLPELENKLASIQSGTVVLVCQTGKRSLQACGQLKNSFGSSKNIYSLRGGIVHWKQLHKTVV